MQHSEMNPVQKFELCFRAENDKIYIYHLQLNEFGIVYEELQTLKKRKAVASSLFKAEKQDDGSWIASAREAGGLSKRMDKFLTGDSIGLLISKFALLGDEDALAVVEWMTNMLYPESLVSNVADDVIKLEADMQILEDERYLDIFRMVDYSVCR